SFQAANIAADASSVAEFALTLPASVQTDAATTVRVVAVDTQDDAITTYDGTANLSSTDPAATLPATVDFQNGVATFQVNFATPGQQIITATDSSNEGLTGQATTTVAAPATPVTTSPPVGSTSSNWSGYAALTNLNNPQAGSVT